MKTKIFLLILATFLINFSGCNKDDEYPPVTKVMFWSRDPGDPVEVSVDGINYGTITIYYSNYTGNNYPPCGSNGTVNVTLSVGSHSVYATSGSGFVNATIEVPSLPEGACYPVRIN
ncbi:MAG TPA: hypothetical protein VNJ07_09490 [Chitinophagales bacterium]|nr:hypothetical protein [Chitinophagales bacterium]